MKKPIIVVNWKMNLVGTLAQKKAMSLKQRLSGWSGLDVVLCPSFLDLESISKAGNFSKESNLFLGAQDCFWKLKGDYTGEVSPSALKDLGCDYVILGNSERRIYFQENNQKINAKVGAALLAGLTPIICVGETIEERRKGAKDYVVLDQISGALQNINLRATQKIIIAYEPVWVKNSGQAISPEEAIYMNKIIFQRMIDLYPRPLVKNNIRFIYGGSVDSCNASPFFEKGLTDGFLIGKASLDLDEFIALCRLITKK
ncbi:triose-phosphate isomerase [Patescibacteria group bacterium]|nr:triose-phosphate isomerase [Patescibacteria group bacterium]